MAARRATTRVYAPTYFEESQQPLASLGLLLPLVFLYEIGALVAGPSAVVDPAGRVVAFQLLAWFFTVFGATSLHLPALAVVAVLLAWHIACRDRWVIHVPTIGLMAVESILLAGPLLVMSRLIGPPALAATVQRGFLGEVVVSVGAGIYEELLFRLILISLLGMLLVDLAGMRKQAGYTVAILVSSALFAGHHYQPVGSDVFDSASFAFRLAAGIYLAVVFVLRGFGIAVGCHAAYDLALVMLETWAPR
ncbi:MAG TPA: CPBP family intramembrane glutamic endopeptidase [Phycisphaerae bacterium]|nr:CPBP family intramembrane glutamic endopeptidase [Phycisphaerae bacterium]